jgi:hypothetical protein
MPQALQKLRSATFELTMIEAVDWAIEDEEGGD